MRIRCLSLLSLSAFFLLLAGGQAMAADPEFDVSKIDFKGPVQAVTVDKEGPIANFDTLPADGIEWKDDAPTNGNTELSWPVAYVRNAQPSADVTLKMQNVPAGTAISLSGTGRLASKTLVFKGTATTAGNQVTVETTATGTLPNKVALGRQTQIDWTINIGSARYATENPTKHNIYLMDAAPLAGYTDKIYLSMLDIDSEGAHKRAGAKGVVKGIYSEYTERNEDGIPILKRRDYNTTTGEILLGKALTYWGPDAATCPTTNRAQHLLANPNTGRCDQWGPFLRHSLAIEGIASTVRQIDCEFLTEVPAVGQEPCWIMVKNWSLGGTGGGNWPFTFAGSTDLQGAPAQNNANPDAQFSWHVVVEFEGRIYDPSYGTGPFATLAKWESKSLDGFICVGVVGCNGNVRRNSSNLETVIYDSAF